MPSTIGIVQELTGEPVTFEAFQTILNEHSVAINTIAQALDAVHQEVLLLESQQVINGG